MWIPHTGLIELGRLSVPRAGKDKVKWEWEWKYVRFCWASHQDGSEGKSRAHLLPWPHQHYNKTAEQSSSSIAWCLAEQSPVTKDIQKKSR